MQSRLLQGPLKGQQQNDRRNRNVQLMPERVER